MPDGTPTSATYDLGHYLRPLKRHRALVIFAVLAGLVLGVGYSVAKSPIYTAAVKVQVDATTAANQAASVNATGSRTNQPVNLDTESQIVKSTTVGQLVQQALGTVTSVDALLSRVAVTVPPNSTILRISCTGHSPLSSQDCANAFGQAYLTNRFNVEKDALNSEIQLTKNQIVQAQKAINTESAAVIAAPPHTAKKNYAVTVEATLQTAANQLDSQLNQETTTVPDAGHFISKASPGITSKTKREIPPIAGIVLGLIIGVAAVFGRERVDGKVRNSDNLAAAGVGLIAEVPRPSGRGGAARRREDIARSRFDQRLANVIVNSFDAQGGVVYLACVSAGQADGNIAAHLADTLELTGHEVEIIRPAAITRPQPAAAEYAAKRAPAEQLADPAAPVSVGWPAGHGAAATEPEGAGAALGAFLRPTVGADDSLPALIRAELEKARRRARFVLIDGDPAIEDPNAYIVAGLSDASVLVVDPEKTKRDDLRETVDQISVTRSRLLGAVIWRPSRRKSRDDATPSRRAEADGRDRASGAQSPAPRPVDAAR